MRVRRDRALLDSRGVAATELVAEPVIDSLGDGATVRGGASRAPPSHSTLLISQALRQSLEPRLSIYIWNASTIACP